jgi:hypothetical protein
MHLIKSCGRDRGLIKKWSIAQREIKIEISKHIYLFFYTLQLRFKNNMNKIFFRQFVTKKTY